MRRIKVCIGSQGNERIKNPNLEKVSQPRKSISPNFCFAQAISYCSLDPSIFVLFLRLRKNRSIWKAKKDLLCNLKENLQVIWSIDNEAGWLAGWLASSCSTLPSCTSWAESRPMDDLMCFSSPLQSITQCAGWVNRRLVQANEQITDSIFL